MPAERKPGMDNEFYDWSPITTRPALTWPADARVALCVILNLEHYEWSMPEGWFQPPSPGGLGRGTFPDLRSYSHHEYGNRVGIFRVLDILDRYGIPPTVAMDATVAKNYPLLIEECDKRGAEFIGHGQTVNRMITSDMSEEEERQYIRESVGALEEATGTRPEGWFGPEYGESTRTPSLLASEGIRYVCDWPNDEQPYPMKVAEGRLFSLPVHVEVDDIFTQWNRGVSIMHYSQMIRDTFDGLYVDGAETGRTLVLSLHPWLIGQPFRSKYLDIALAHISRHASVWKATGKEIVDWYEEQR